MERLQERHPLKGSAPSDPLQDRGSPRLCLHVEKGTRALLRDRAQKKRWTTSAYVRHVLALGLDLDMATDTPAAEHSDFFTDRTRQEARIPGWEKVGAWILETRLLVRLAIQTFLPERIELHPSVALERAKQDAEEYIQKYLQTRHASSLPTFPDRHEEKE